MQLPIGDHSQLWSYLAVSKILQVYGEKMPFLQGVSADIV